MERTRSARTLAAVEAGPVANKTKQRPKQREIANRHEETQQKMEVVGDVSTHVAALSLGSGQLQASNKAGNVQASKHIK